MKKARELHEQSGLPMRWAVKVASGQMSLGQAVKELQERDRVARLVEQGKLLPGMAAAVTGGNCTLEEGLKTTALKRRKQEKDYQKSHLTDFAASHAAVTLALVSGRLVTGTLTRDEPFAVAVQDREGQVTDADKHDVKFFFKAGDRKKVFKNIKTGTAAQLLEPGALKERKARKKLKARNFVGPLEEGRTVAWTTVEGDVIRGKVVWFGRFEVILETGNGIPVYIMRHAFAAME